MVFFLYLRIVNEQDIEILPYESNRLVVRMLSLIHFRHCEGSFVSSISCLPLFLIFAFSSLSLTQSRARAARRVPVRVLLNRRYVLRSKIQEPVMPLRGTQ